MWIWHRFVLLFFPGSLEEYQLSRQIHLSEMRRYRRQPQFIAGLVLFFGPLMYLIMTASARDDWVTMILIGCLLFGEICIRDTISEHYCLLLYRLGYGKQKVPDSLDTLRDATDWLGEGVGSPVQDEKISLTS
jgi:hypothetical protein